MNTIQSPRKRPRVRSVNFRALYWAVCRQAFLNVWVRGVLSMVGPSDLRLVMALPPSSLERWARVILAARPERRFYP